MIGAPEHYSYRVYASRGMAERFDALRFSGPIGTMLADAQARILAEALGDIRGRRILDVGTGTGRAALLLAARGAAVTGIDASPEMLRVAAARAGQEGLSVRFDVGDAHRLAFDSSSFDAAVSLRVLMHAPNWRECLHELCRVARDRVVFDYPAACSAAAIQAAARRILATLGREVEAYRVLRLASVKAVLDECGYRVDRVHRQFVLPIALHRAIGSRAVTERCERSLAAVGLLRLFGSPVTVVAVRCGSS
ncbi:MAG: class I SAM-dependent methyltransferase [Acidobacteriota bacterium]